MNPIRIATRKSPLALWQANQVKNALQQSYESLRVDIIPITSEGDRLANASLAELGGKGLFTKTLEDALIDDKADIAVHSLKDMPAKLPDGMRLGGVLRRGNINDALVTNLDCTGLFELDNKAIIGTSSARRKSQLIAINPTFNIQPIRGSIETRLKKLDDNQFDAIILAEVALTRLNLENRITATIPIEAMLPAPGQAAIGCEVRDGDKISQDLLSKINHLPTWHAIRAERAVSVKLEANCHTPIACHAYCEGGSLFIKSMVADYAGEKHVWVEQNTTILANEFTNPNSVIPLDIGHEVATELLAKGAAELLG